MYIQRDLEKKLEKYMPLKEILAIIGPRQAGKTTMIQNFLKNYKNKKINQVTFEDITTLQLFEEDIENFIKINIKDFDILFIDEIQYSKNSGQKLKYIFDTIKDIKIIISGSSASEISLQSLKYLVGRILIFELQTFSFLEFLKYKDEKLYKITISNKYKDTILSQINKYILEYLTFGGYPQVVLTDDKEIKINYLKSIYNTYLLREIKEILDLKDNFKLNNLIKTLSLQIGNIVNYNELSASTGISINEIKNVLNVLKQTYISDMILPYYTNKQKELVKSPKVFFFDLGFRNVAINNFELENITNIGAIYENFIYTQLLRESFEIKYWRSKTQAEVDFVIEKDSNLISIEVKTNLINNVIGKGYISFLNKYKPKKAFMLSLNYKNERLIENINVNFYTFAEFIIEMRNS